MSEQTQEDPQYTIAKAQEIINILRETLQNTSDALISVQVDNRFMKRHIEEQERTIERLSGQISAYANDTTVKENPDDGQEED